MIGQMIALTPVQTFNDWEVWWSSEILSLLWAVSCPAGPTYMGYQNLVDHHTATRCLGLS
jgi:hypothetical protein